MNDTQIDERFFNFPPETVAAIRAYQRSRDPELVMPVFKGIMARYLPENAGRIALDQNGTDAPINAFGLESLTLLEVLLDLEDALGIRLEDRELGGVHNLGEAHSLLLAKVTALRGREAAAEATKPQA